MSNVTGLSEQKNTQFQKGFTLIELLVALGVSAIISVLAYQAINSMLTTKTTVEAHSQRVEELQRALWWMEQDIIQVAPRSISDGLDAHLPAFQFRSDLGLELTRIAEYPTPYASGGLLRVGYQLEEGVLYRVVWPVVDRAPDSQPVRYPILDSVLSFELRLLKKDNQWLLYWPIPESDQMNTALPKMTEVKVELEDLGEVTRLFVGGH